MLKSRAAYLYLLPGFAGLLAFNVIPFFGGARYAFFTDRVPRVFIGLDTIVDVMTNPTFLLALQNTIFFTLVCAPLSVLLAFVLACALSGEQKIKAAGRISMLMPYVLPTASVILVWQILFGNSGAINQALDAVAGRRFSFLTSDAMRVPVVALYIWRYTGYILIVIYAALQTVPPEYYDFVRLEGSSFVTKHWRVTLPLISPSLMFALILAWIFSMRVFKDIYALSGAYPSQRLYTLQHYINNQFQKMNYGRLTAAAYLFAAIVLLLFAVIYTVERRFRDSMNP